MKVSVLLVYIDACGTRFPIERRGESNVKVSSTSCRQFADSDCDRRL